MPGDFIEFGAYRGFSLLWIAYLAERAGIFDKKIIGLDGFTGLPYADGVWRKYAFSDASLNTCRRNVFGSRQLYKISKRNIIIERALFRDQAGILKILAKHQVKQLSFIHVDCDVSQSFLEIAELLFNARLIAPRAYLLLDDYSHDSDLRYHVKRVLKTWREFYDITDDSATKFTRNYLLVAK